MAIADQPQHSLSRSHWTGAFLKTSCPKDGFGCLQVPAGDSKRSKRSQHRDAIAMTWVLEQRKLDFPHCRNVHGHCTYMIGKLSSCFALVRLGSSRNWPQMSARSSMWAPEAHTFLRLFIHSMSVIHLILASRQDLPCSCQRSTPEPRAVVKVVNSWGETCESADLVHRQRHRTRVGRTILCWF